MKHHPSLATAVAALLLPCVLAVALPVRGAPAPDPGARQGEDGLLATLWARRAAEHDLVFTEIYRNAREKLKAALADPAWDALPGDERDTPVKGLPPAIIMDVDETLLNNSPYEAGLVASHRDYDAAAFRQWAGREKAKPLPGALEFTRYAASLGIHIIYISNRPADLEKVTLANLRKDGFPFAGKSSYLGPAARVPGCHQAGNGKQCRRRLVGRSWRVLMMFGDQLGDFVQVIANTADGRAGYVAPYRQWIGSRWWILPNPMYGGWLPAQFDNRWNLPRNVRRKAEMDALRPGH